MYGIGKNNYKHIKEITNYIKEINNNICIQINTVVFSKNIDLLDSLFNEVKNMNIDILNFVKFSPFRGKARDQENNLSISDQVFNSICAKYKKYKSRFKIIFHDKDAMIKKHYIILSSGELVCSENGEDKLIKKRLY